MAVQRHDEAQFDAPPSVVARAVRSVLSQRPPYLHTTELEQENRFTTNVRPRWFLLGTDMTIELQPSGQGTQVSVGTRSQWFITGDIFGFYNRYIRDFLRDLKMHLQTQTAT